MNKFYLALALSSAPLFAQEGAPAPVAKGSMGVDLTTAYFFRGILQEDQGVIAQPWIELGYDIGDLGGGLHDGELVFGLWNSLHDGPTGGAGGPWYESDFYIGLHSSVGEKWSAGATYTAYASPNGSFGTVEELAFSLGFDDAEESWTPVVGGLQPSVLVAFEVDGQADAGTHLGTYAQLSVEPSFALGRAGDLDVLLSVPVTLGLSLRDYYEVGGSDDFFGFLDVGAVASSDLPFLPAGMGPWQGSIGLHMLLLGDKNELRNGGDAAEFILSFGLSTTF